MDLKNPDCTADISTRRKRRCPRERNINKREAEEKIEKERLLRQVAMVTMSIRVRIRVRVTFRERVRIRVGKG